MKPWFSRRTTYRFWGIKAPGISRSSGFTINLHPITREGWAVTIGFAVLAGFNFLILPLLIGESFTDSGIEWNTRATFGIPVVFLGFLVAFAFSGPEEAPDEEGEE